MHSSLGNMYIADQSNHRIRKVSAADGVITTIAGLGSYGYSGDNGQATAAELYGPSGVAVDTSGNFPSISYILR
jgi:DNA-binding beta-propeller fold protein YncE